jgi:hypothetical protein
VANALTVTLRDPVERIGALYEERRADVEGLGWGLADIYLELGGGGPDSSELHARFGDFFNGQTRAALAGGGNQPKLEYWAGIPERGAALRDEALRVLTGGAAGGDAGEMKAVTARAPGSRPGAKVGLDPRTRALVVAHNQIDAELYAYFAGIPAQGERRRPWLTGDAAELGEAICVLGMSRSGTSLVARVLNILGVALGSEEGLLDPAADNPAGFWEHAGVAAINDEILKVLCEAPHQQWRWPGRFEPGWERDPRLERQREAAETLLRESFAGQALWGWKDPRTCLTLPFWQDLVPRMRYVICVRDPLGVAASLELRDGLSREEGLGLWLRYLADAVVHTSGRPRLFVAYEAFFGGWEEQAARLAEFAGTGSLTPAQRVAIAAHVEDGLWHHREEQRRPAGPPGETFLRRAADFHALLSALCARGPGGEPAAEADLDAAARRIAELPAQK